MLWVLLSPVFQRLSVIKEASKNDKMLVIAQNYSVESSKAVY